MKKVVKIVLTITLIISIVFVTFAVDMPQDSIQKDIDSINSQIINLSNELEYEGLYYYKIRQLLNSYNFSYEIDMIYNNDPYYDAWFGKKSEGNSRLITDKDLNILPYTGPGAKLSVAEKKIAEDFSYNYICKSTGDMLNILLTSASNHINYLSSKGVIKQNIWNMFTSDLNGYKFIGDEETKRVLMAMPEFNREGLVMNESGYYSNYIFLERNK